MTKLFLVPSTDRVKADVVRPLTTKERAKLRKDAGGDATPSQLESLAGKFGKRHGDKVKVAKVVEIVNFFGNFDDDPDDDPATPSAVAA